MWPAVARQLACEVIMAPLKGTGLDTSFGVVLDVNGAKHARRRQAPVMQE